MFTRFFSTSKPINFLIIAIGMCFFYTMHVFVSKNTAFSLNEIAMHGLILMLYVFGMLLIDFISRKNKLSQNSTYTILFYACFVSSLPLENFDISLIISQLFILFALRRIISLRTKKEVKKKLFDASLWISIAACFYFWSMLFFIILVIALIYYASKNYRHWLIPFLGILTCLILVISGYLIVNDTFPIILEWIQYPSFEFKTYNNTQLLVPITFLLVMTFWTGFAYLNKVRKTISKFRQVLFIVLYWLATTLVIIIITPIKNGAEFFFLVVPLAIVSNTYIENIKEKWFGEALLWITVLLPFIMLVLS